MKMTAEENARYARRVLHETSAKMRRGEKLTADEKSLRRIILGTRNPKKNSFDRRPRVADLRTEDFEEEVRGEGSSREELVTRAQRRDGIWITRPNEPRNAPLPGIHIPRKPIAMIRDPWHGQGKHKRNVKKGLAAFYQERDSIRRREALAFQSAREGHREKVQRVFEGRGKNTLTGLAQAS